MILKKNSLFSDIKYYLNLQKEIKAHLSKAPNEWNKLQSIFDLSINKIYDDIINLEKDNIDKFEAEVYRGKKIFEKRYRKYFLCGEYIKWCFEKPYGYAGDHKIIDDIYQNSPKSTGFNRLWDNWFMKLPTVRAVRERKEDFKRIIREFQAKHTKGDMRIMNLASGPAREIKELLEDESQLFANSTFDCYDVDSRAINYAKTLLKNTKNVNFFVQNAIRLALKKDITKEIDNKYDIIYSTGLFDYLDEKIASRLVSNLKKLLKKNGIMVISNARDKYSNPSTAWMEWVVEWYLIYRNENEFKMIFTNANLASRNLKIIVQNSKVMQYCLVNNR